MSKQTSIEWYAEKDTELTIKFLEGKLNQVQLAIEKIKCFEEAKKKHKQEIVNTFNSADSLHYFGQDIDKDGHDYYDEIYGGNNG